MINPHWLKLPMSRTNFHGPKDVRAIKVRLYSILSFGLNFVFMPFFHKKLSGMANGVGPDQTAPARAVLSGSAVFARAILSETFEVQSFNTFTVHFFLWLKTLSLSFLCIQQNSLYYYFAKYFL